MSAPRIPPGSRQDIGRVNWAIARVIGLATGGRPPNGFTTLARHRALFRRWLRFARGLMPRRQLPRETTELLILHTAHNTGCDYEWHHHERIGQTAGLTAEEIARVREGPDAAGWSPRRQALLRAADELHADRTISDAAWAPLRAELVDHELIELCLLVGHYQMLAMTLNALQVQPDAPSGPRPKLVQRIQSRRN